MSKTVILAGEIHTLKIGLNTIRVLLNNPDINVGEHLPILLNLLLSHEKLPSGFSHSLTEDERKNLSPLVVEMLEAARHFSFAQLDNLYSTAVGELGIGPVEANQMEPDEIELAYQGYLRRLETEANLILIAVRKSFTENDELIRLTADEGYTVGSEYERQETFKRLGIV